MSYALLIDDDTSLVSEVQEVVRAAGYHLQTATTWEDGLARFNGLAPELVIADYNLPGSRHGLQLLLEIARLRPSVRLVLVSAYLKESDVRKVEALGLVDNARRKLSPVDTARFVMGLVETAFEDQGKQTDWRAFALARKRKGVGADDLAKLDDFLQAERLGTGPETA